jgi:hypothetical protein
VAKPIVYLKSTLAGLLPAVVVLASAAAIERRRAEKFFHSFTPPPIDGHDGSYGYVVGADFGPGIFTLMLALAVFAAGFYWVFRRASPRDEPQFMSVIPSARSILESGDETARRKP